MGEQVWKTYKPTDRQKAAHANPATHLLFGGAKGGGKSMALCWEAWMNMMEYPGNHGFLGRRRFKDLKDTTLFTWFMRSQIPSDSYVYREHRGEITFPKVNSVLTVGGLDDPKLIEKLNSAEYGFLGIDQIEELELHQFSMLRATLRWRLPNNLLPRYRGFYTANPAPGWVKDIFLNAPPPGYAFIQSLPKDNEYLPPTYTETLHDAFRDQPKLLKAYLEGSWDELEGEDIVLPYRKLQGIIDSEIPDYVEMQSPRTIIGCDPARFGDDETVCYVVRNGKLIDQWIRHAVDTMETTGQLAILRRNYNAEYIAVETGMGQGIIDRLREMGEPVLEFNPASKATNDGKYANLRAEAWFDAKEMIRQRLVSIPSEERFMSAVLIGQLSSVKYNVRSDARIILEHKEQIKSRLGRSPDRADAFIIALWALRQANSSYAFTPDFSNIAVST